MNISTDRGINPHEKGRGPRQASLLSWVFLASIGVLCICFGWYAGASSGLDLLFAARTETIVAGSFVLTASAVYLFGKFTPERMVVLMLLTIPLVSSLVIDIGGSVRINYLFALMAVFVGIYMKRMAFPHRGLTLALLLGFVLYALFSISYTLYLPSFTSVTSEGFRGLPIRSLIQFGQLILMLIVFYVVLNYATSLERLSKLSKVIFWSLVGVVGYGTYEFLTAVYGLPFINLDTAPTSLSVSIAPHAGDLARTFGDISLPRPHSTFPEPIDLTAYLMFAMPFGIVATGLARREMHRIYMAAFILLSAAFFVVANSRAGFIAVAVVIPFFLIMAPSWRVRVRFAGAAAALSLVIAFVVFPMIGSPLGFSAPYGYFKENYKSLLSLTGRSGQNDEPLAVFQKSPVLGVGIGNYPFYAQRPRTLSGGVPTTGNLYTRVLSELGLVGTVLFLGFVLSILVGLWKVMRKSTIPQLRHLAFAALMAISGMLVVKIGTVGLYTESHMWVAFAMGLAIVRLHASERSVRTNGPAHRGSLPEVNGDQSAQRSTIPQGG